MADQELDLEALFAGKKSAWDRFVKRFAPLIFSAINKKLGPAGRLAEADDVAQDVFLRLCKDDYRLLKNYDSSRAKLSTWLTVVTSSVTIDYLRKRVIGAGIDIEKVPERFTAVEQKFTEVVKIPDGLLSPRQGLVIELLYRREMEVVEVAAALQVDPQTVRSMHHKALIRLREHFTAEEAG